MSHITLLYTSQRVSKTFLLLVDLLDRALKAVEHGDARVAFVAQDCDEAKISEVVVAVCNEKGVKLVNIPSRSKLGEWVGLAKLDEDGEVRKTCKCTFACITDYGIQSPALDRFQEHIKTI